MISTASKQVSPPHPDNAIIIPQRRRTIRDNQTAVSIPWWPTPAQVCELQAKDEGTAA
jgi:hypothetical protein